MVSQSRMISVRLVERNNRLVPLPDMLESQLGRCYTDAPCRHDEEVAAINPPGRN